MEKLFNSKRLNHIISYLDKHMILGPINKDINWQTHKEDGAATCYSLKIQLTIGHLKKVFGSRYSNDIIINDCIFVQLCYAIENEYVTPTIVMQVPIERLRLFSSKFMVYSCENLKYLGMLNTINCSEQIQWTYDGLGLTKDGAVAHTCDGWKSVVRARLKEWADELNTIVLPITMENIKKKTIISRIRTDIADFSIPIKEY
jgi:hypothetical protein